MLKEAGVAYAGPRSSATSATHALVVVFPNDPVIPITSGEISPSLRSARWTKRRLSSVWIGLTAVSATKISSGVATTTRMATPVPMAGATQAGAPARTATAASDEDERRQAERHHEQPADSRREDERLRLRPPQEPDSSDGERDADACAQRQHEPVEIRRGQDREGDAGRQAQHQRAHLHPRFAPLDPHAQASALVVLQLEQMQHEVQAAGDVDEQPGGGGDQAGGGHCSAATSRGCSMRNRRATAPNWPGESA